VHKFQESDIEINQCCFGWKQDKTVSIGLLSIVRQKPATLVGKNQLSLVLIICIEICN
jgi:hypothetical protein